MLSITLFVDDDDDAASTSPDGLGWESAYSDLQTALSRAATLNADAIPFNNVDRIWIAEGVYSPSAQLDDDAPRSASFSLVDGLALYGGFAGTETTLAERDISAHPTILSGDLGTLDDTSDNAYTVVYCGESIEASLDSLSIVDGNASDGYNYKHPEGRSGGGIYNAGNLAITNSTLTSNSANEYGGGIYNSGSLTVTDSTLAENSTSNSYSSGGGIYNKGDLIITSSTLSGNSAESDGGGIYNTASLTITSSTLTGNSAESNGGGISNSQGNLVITSSILSGNSAERGGGVHSYLGDQTITNSTLTDNSADYGGGIYNSSGTLALNNSILWQNNGEELAGQINFSGTQNLIGIDPLFVDPAGGDYRLQATSPAINSGDNNLAVDADGNPLSVDADGNARIHDATVDCGAFEFQGTVPTGRETPSITVTTPSDVFDLYDGQITLREAIFYASSGELGADLAFDAALDGATITLLGTSLFINKSLTIDALSLMALTIDADDQSRVFTVLTSDEDAVTLNDLTITGGSASRGGGISCDGNLVVTNSTLSGNSADYGGGIYNTGDLTVTNSTLSGNSASNGGGIYSSSISLTLNNSILWQNHGEELAGQLNFSGTNNLIGIDPLFVDPAGGQGQRAE